MLFCPYLKIEFVGRIRYNVVINTTESEGIMLAVPKKKLDTNDKYLQQLEDIKIRVPKGYRDIIKQFAIDQKYKNVNQLVIGLINEKMEQVGYEQRIPSGIREVKEDSAKEAE